MLESVSTEDEEDVKEEDEEDVKEEDEEDKEKEEKEDKEEDVDDEGNIYEMLFMIAIERDYNYIVNVLLNDISKLHNKDVIINDAKSTLKLMGHESLYKYFINYT